MALLRGEISIQGIPALLRQNSGQIAEHWAEQGEFMHVLIIILSSTHAAFICSEYGKS
jgi:hypothetical protein